MQSGKFCCSWVFVSREETSDFEEVMSLLKQFGVIRGGYPADELKRRFTGAGIEYVRLLSIEEPRAAQQGNALIVLLRVEAIVRGEKVTVDIKPHIEPVEANAGRYYISGGI